MRGQQRGQRKRGLFPCPRGVPRLDPFRSRCPLQDEGEVRFAGTGELGVGRMGGVRSGARRVGEAIFTPQRTTLGTATGDRGKLTEGFSTTARRTAAVILMETVVLVRGLRVGGKAQE